MSDRIGNEVRDLVATRAKRYCEYCLIHEDDTFLGCEIDHVISLKHGGTDDIENLAFACVFCNRHKGSDIASVFPPTGELVRLFNPRQDPWADHFKIEGARILPLTKIGEATARILGFNYSDRILERQALLFSGRYPGPAQLI
jgi:HNH endonuclease